MTAETRVAIVTGGGVGIGAAVARRLAADGATVAIDYAKSESRAAALAEEIVMSGGRAVAIRGDVGVAGDIRSLFDQTIERFGRLDVLVNNAGIGSEAPISSMPLEQFEGMIRTNLFGTFLCMQQAASRMEDGGRIVSISSGSTFDTGIGSGPLAASKAGIEQLTKSLALELAPRRITVNAIVPHFIETDGFTPAVREQNAEVIAAIPLGGLGQPSDVAAAIAFLASNDGRWVTGQSIRVTGGL